MPDSRPAVRQSIRQAASFAIIGAISTVAYLALYAALRTAIVPLIANALALVITAVGNTAANRRWTFDVRGTDGLAADHAAGLAAFLIALAITTVSIGLLQSLAPHTGRLLELSVLVAANGLATVSRFLLLRPWFSPGRILPRAAGAATASTDSGTR